MSNNFNPNKRAYDLREHEERIERLIVKNYSISFMSNTKWRKLFLALDIDGMILNHVLLKCVDKDKPRRWHMPKTDEIEKIWVTEGKHGCDYVYKEMEWLELLNTAKPSNVPYRFYEQTVELATSVIKSLGEFETEKTPLGLRIYGYK